MSISSPPHRVAAAVALAVTMALGACSDPASAPDPQTELASRRAGNRPVPACDLDNGGLTLPAGFCAVVVAKNAVRARQMAVRPNGDLYVAIDNGPNNDPVGAVLALRDADGDGRAEIQVRFGPTGGNGIDWHGSHLYFAPDDRILRYSFSGNELVPSGAPVTLVSGLTAGADHHRKTVVVDKHGKMFVNIGSATNSCQVVNRVDFSPGVDPCPELPVRAGVWRFSASTPGQTQASGMRFATELRNMNALAINPDDGKLYGVQNGRDQLFDNWGTLFTARDDALLPAEELFRISQGKAYGWPYCYYDGMRNKKVLNPEYGGDGKRVGRCASRERPIETYPAHWAPLSMLFYTGSQFPDKYEGGLFIAWHGSRFDPALQPAGPGYNVTFNKWRHGKPAGKFDIFADNFAGGVPTPAGAAHRPLGLAQAPDGSLYISDDKAGWIWRVFYRGSRNR